MTTTPAPLGMIGIIKLIRSTASLSLAESKGIADALRGAGALNVPRGYGLGAADEFGDQMWKLTNENSRLRGEIEELKTAQFDLGSLVDEEEEE